MNRHIVCFETAYDQKWERRKTMAPAFEPLKKVDGMRHVHFSCHTRPEFEFNLTQFNAKANFQIFTWAGHGASDTLCFANKEEWTLDE